MEADMYHIGRFKKYNVQRMEKSRGCLISYLKTDGNLLLWNRFYYDRCKWCRIDNFEVYDNENPFAGCS